MSLPLMFKVSIPSQESCYISQSDRSISMVRNNRCFEDFIKHRYVYVFSTSKVAGRIMSRMTFE